MAWIADAKLAAAVSEAAAWESLPADLLPFLGSASKLKKLRPSYGQALRLEHYVDEP